MQVRFRFMTKEHICIEEKTCIVTEQVLLSYFMRKEKIAFSFPCGGNGICGKCKVRVCQNAAEPTAEEKKLFSEAELSEGFRLACQMTITEDCVIELPAREEFPEKTVAVKRNAQREDADGFSKENLIKKTKRYGIAIDLGTTTLAFALVDKEKECLLQTVTMENSQKKFGADVMSRMQYANNGGAKELCETIKSDLRYGVGELLRSFFGEADETLISELAIAGNTTMCHLLLGYSCEGLAVAPFVPVSLARVETTYRGIPVSIFPGVSAFIGGDIVAGLAYLHFKRDDTPKLLLDLGTNGEMVLWTGKRFLATSASAGPALEGGNISCGCAGVIGAVCDVVVAGKKNHIKTIGNAPAVGMCGSGILSLISGLLKNHLLDSDGLLAKDYRENGYELQGNIAVEKIALKQEDVRAFQLAKSAIATGVEYLFARGTECEMQETEIYLAGGLGTNLSVAAAKRTGLLPKNSVKACKNMGNTSLQGAISYLLHPSDILKRTEDICAGIEVLPLNAWDCFEAQFIKNINF